MDSHPLLPLTLLAARGARVALRLLLVVLPAGAAAAPDARVVQELVRNFGHSQDDVRAHYQTGCESGVTRHMRICMNYQTQLVEVRLNDQYRELLSRLRDRRARARLVEAQRAWIQYRDLECRFSSHGWAGGSFRPIAIAACHSGFAKQRLAEIESYLACDAEEPDCPAHESGVPD